MFKKLFKITVLLYVIILLASCCVLFPNKCYVSTEPGPKTLEISVKSLIDKLEYEIRIKDKSNYINIEAIPFIYIESSNNCNNFTTLYYNNKSIEDILINGSDRSGNFFKFKKDIKKPHYSMYAVIEKIPYGFDKISNLPRISYRLTVKIIDNEKNITILTNDTTSIKKENKVSIQKIFNIPNQTKIEKNYKLFFPIKCNNEITPIVIPIEFEKNIENAEQAFNEEKFEEALKYYQKVFKILDKNKVLENEIPVEKKNNIYVNFIESSYRLLNTDFKEEIFAQIYQKWLINRFLNMNQEVQWTFLFNENSTEFVNDIDVEMIYLQRLKMIGQYFNNTNLCLNIVGYNLKTESNLQENLAKQRIELIRKNLLKYAPKLSFEEKEETVAKHNNNNNSYPEYRKVKIYVKKNCP